MGRVSISHREGPRALPKGRLIFNSRLSDTDRQERGHNSLGPALVSFQCMVRPLMARRKAQHGLDPNASRELSTCIISSWVVKRGRDLEFVAAWQAYAKWLISKHGSKGSPQLFRDNLDPAHYVSIDYWDDNEALTAIRNSVYFCRESYRLQQLTMHFSSWTLTPETSGQA